MQSPPPAVFHDKYQGEIWKNTAGKSAKISPNFLTYNRPVGIPCAWRKLIIFSRCVMKVSWDPREWRKSVCNERQSFLLAVSRSKVSHRINRDFSEPKRKLVLVFAFFSCPEKVAKILAWFRLANAGVKKEQNAVRFTILSIAQIRPQCSLFAPKCCFLAPMLVRNCSYCLGQLISLEIVQNQLDWTTINSSI